MYDLISRQAAIDALGERPLVWTNSDYEIARENQWETDKLAIETVPSAQAETCEGCKHLGKWENEVEYGYPSPCTCCKRRVEDHYER